MPKIYCFLNSRDPEWLVVMAIAEDGHCLAQHVSSSKGWAMHDIGLGSDWKHEAYKEHYPNGYELEWVDNVKQHEGLMQAYKLNQELARLAKEEPSHA